MFKNGSSRRAIARELGIARNTVNKYINEYLDKKMEISNETDEVQIRILQKHMVEEPTRKSSIKKKIAFTPEVERRITGITFPIDDFLMEIGNFEKSEEYMLPSINKLVHYVFKNEDKKLIGIAGAWVNNNHPNRMYISSYVDPIYRNKGIATKLLIKLMTFVGKKKLQTQIYKDNKYAVNLVKKLKFILARKTYILNFNRDSIDFTKIINENNDYIFRVKELSDDLIELLVDESLKVYTFNHKAINPVDITREKWKDYILSNLDYYYSFVEMKEGKIISYILSYLIDSENVEVGYVGINDKINNDFLYMCFREIFQKYQFIEFEADDTDKAAMYIIDLFDLKIEETLETYILN